VIEYPALYKNSKESAENSNTCEAKALKSKTVLTSNLAYIGMESTTKKTLTPTAATDKRYVTIKDVYETTFFQDESTRFSAKVAFINGKLKVGVSRSWHHKSGSWAPSFNNCFMPLEAWSKFVSVVGSLTAHANMAAAVGGTDKKTS
jgi:hypothetical protein